MAPDRTGRHALVEASREPSQGQMLVPLTISHRPFHQWSFPFHLLLLLKRFSGYLYDLECVCIAPEQSLAMPDYGMERPSGTESKLVSGAYAPRTHGDELPTKLSCDTSLRVPAGMVYVLYPIPPKHTPTSGSVRIHNATPRSLK